MRNPSFRSVRSMATVQKCTQVRRVYVDETRPPDMQRAFAAEGRSSQPGFLMLTKRG